MVDANRLTPLREAVTRFHEEQQRRHTLNFRANWALVVLALASTAMAIVGGVLNWNHDYIALIGVTGSVSVGLQAALAIEDKAEFQRVVASDARTILLYLDDTALTDDDFVKLRDQFATLQSEANKRLPRGGGVEAARNLPPPPSPP